MRRALAWMGCAVLGLLVMGDVRADSPTPNILVIVGDDLGYADVGFHGCRDIPTPHLDALAAAGVRFTNGYVTGPYCSPTRAGLLTGRYQTRFGHEFNPSGGKQGLPVDQATLADRLAAAGYRTALIGKWHLGSSPAMHPLKRGFHEFFGFLEGAHSFFDARGIFRGEAAVPTMDYTTDAFAREATEFIRKNQEQPWFLYLSFNAVHTPMHATPERLGKFAHLEDPQRRTYAAMMSAMDDAIGQVRAAVSQSGQTERTLIAFFSDNGGPTMAGTTVNGSKNDPFRGSKRTTLEGGIRVPFVLAWPGRIRSGVYDQPVIQLDVHATALAAARVEPRPDWQLDGVDLLPYLAGEKAEPPHAALYWRFGEQMAIREGQWKLVRYDQAADAPTGKGTSSVKLFNLAQDRREERDLAASEPDRVRQLQAQWDAWDKANSPPLWGGGAGTGAGAGKKKAKSVNKQADK
ncbi:MAG: sulfatase-like hydrolase/transferase [Pirellulales bacterium]